MGKSIQWVWPWVCPKSSHCNLKAIAADSTLNNDKVWISKDLDPAMSLVVSSISTSLMLLHNLG
ncbi:MAG: hypothetical protein IPN76_18420 [Saprospiraceae bacterium]|nr:hypothetical protein [Saprospiraceae bacterium]